MTGQVTRVADTEEHRLSHVIQKFYLSAHAGHTLIYIRTAPGHDSPQRWVRRCDACVDMWSLQTTTTTLVGTQHHHGKKRNPSQHVSHMSSFAGETKTLIYWPPSKVDGSIDGWMDVRLVGWLNMYLFIHSLTHSTTTPAMGHGQRYCIPRREIHSRILELLHMDRRITGRYQV